MLYIYNMILKEAECLKCSNFFLFNHSILPLSHIQNPTLQGWAPHFCLCHYLDVSLLCYHQPALSLMDNPRPVRFLGEVLGESSSAWSSFECLLDTTEQSPGLVDPTNQDENQLAQETCQRILHTQQQANEFLCWWELPTGNDLANALGDFPGEWLSSMAAKKSINELKRHKWRKRWKGDEHREPAM